MRFRSDALPTLQNQPGGRHQHPSQLADSFAFHIRALPSFADHNPLENNSADSAVANSRKDFAEDILVGQMTVGAARNLAVAHLVVAAWMAAIRTTEASSTAALKLAVARMFAAQAEPAPAAWQTALTFVARLAEALKPH